MYVLIGTRASRAMRVLVTLEELGVPYEHRAENPRSEAVRLSNPSGKIPVLLAEGEALTDSVAIMSWLADRHGALGATAGSIARARLDGWLGRISDEMDALLWTAARHSFILPAEERVPDIKDSLRREWTRNLDRIATDLGNRPYVTGDALTIADILLAHCLSWAVAARFEVAPDNLRDHLSRMRDRPSWQRASAMG